MARSKHSLHIKRHTKGTSNELSFDVLDAARDRLDSQKDRKGKPEFMLDFQRKPGDGRGSDAPRGSGGAVLAPGAETPHTGIHAAAAPVDSKRGRKGRKGRKAGTAAGAATGVAVGVAGSSVGAAATTTRPSNPLIPPDEVLRLKKDRRQRTARRYVLAGLVVVVVVAVIGIFAYRGFQAQESFNGSFQALVDRVAAADADLVEIDAMMDDPVGATTAEDRAIARKRAVSVSSAADAALTGAAALGRSAQAGQDKVVLEQFEVGAQGRKGMVSFALEAFDIADEVGEYQVIAHAVWDAVIDADVAARDAISSSNDMQTTSDLEDVNVVLRQSADEFSVASQQLQGLEASIEGLDFSAQCAYLDKRVEALECAQATNEALMAGDRQAAGVQNDLYEEADRDSASLAAALPQSIDVVVAAAYAEDILAIQARYDKERERVTQADAIVRGYLGI